MFFVGNLDLNDIDAYIYTEMDSDLKKIVGHRKSRECELPYEITYYFCFFLKIVTIKFDDCSPP